ncbi:vesicular-fusion protein S17 [Orbilia brochopaga]|uniref:Vesicular-fusion protein S17 n=1 Tax=Orbilia brochopaga TaxID=3140254 RepID=A0AAV9VBV9_9PEZI
MDGRSLLLKAQKEESSATGSGLLGIFGGSKQDRLEQAIETYAQAANAFRTSGQGQEAGAAFEKAAQLSKAANEHNDAANYLVEAFKSYKKTHPQDAARCMDQAIEHYRLTNLRRAATNKQTLAELYENDIGDKAQAIVEYEKAGEWFSNDNADALGNKCFIKAADLHAETGHPEKSVPIYESIARASLNNNLMKWSVKDYLFKAALCHLATKDVIATKRALLQEYPTMEPAFAPGTMEQLFLLNLLDCVENPDPAAFFQNVMQYKERYPLDNWKLDVLAKTQKSIEDSAEDLT